jgi:hypothetical protein
MFERSFENTPKHGFRLGIGRSANDAGNRDRKLRSEANPGARPWSGSFGLDFDYEIARCAGTAEFDED